MEGIPLEIPLIGAVSTFGFFAGLALLLIAVAAIMLGYFSDEERKGRRLYWAEWPLPGGEVTEERPEEEEVEIRRAA